jgi:fatty acid desaturase
MYAGVPFYNVPKLHKILTHDLPKPVEGYLSGIKKVLSIQKQQRVNPDYCFIQEFPDTANPPKMTE